MDSSSSSRMDDSSPTSSADIAAGRKLIMDVADSDSLAVDPSDFGSDVLDEQAFADERHQSAAAGGLGGAPHERHRATAAAGGGSALLDSNLDHPLADIAEGERGPSNDSIIIYKVAVESGDASTAAFADDAEPGAEATAKIEMAGDGAAASAAATDTSTRTAAKEAGATPKGGQFDDAASAAAAATAAVDGRRRKIDFTIPLRVIKEDDRGEESPRRQPQAPDAKEPPNDQPPAASPAAPAPDRQIEFKFRYDPPDHEREYYDNLFHYANQTKPPPSTGDSGDGGIILPPDQAAKLFLLAGIPGDRLRMIWNMAVMPAIPYPPGATHAPAMTRGQFRSAVRLIQLFQNRVTAKDERLRVDEGVRMVPAHFAGVSGATVLLPGEDGAVSGPAPAAGVTARPGISRRMGSVGGVKTPTAGSDPRPGGEDVGGKRSSTNGASSNAPGGERTRRPAAAAYDGDAPDSAYFMSPDESLAYRETFDRHCVTEHSSRNLSERHVYVDEAVSLFSKSGLPRSTLGKLWDVVVKDADAGKLNEAEFVLMAHLIACVTRRGLGVPAGLPVSLRMWRRNTTDENDYGVGGNNNSINGDINNMNISNHSNTSGRDRDQIDRRNEKKEGANQTRAINEPSPDDDNRRFVPIKRQSSFTVFTNDESVRSGGMGSSGLSNNNKADNGGRINNPLAGAKQRRDDEHRMKRMERQMSSLKKLVGSLTDEVRDLKDLVLGGGGGGEVDGMVAGGGVRDGSSSTAAYDVGSNDDVPNVDLEVYWGENRLDNSDKTVGSPSKPTLSMPKEVPPMPSNLIPSSPKRAPPSVLKQPRMRPPVTSATRAVPMPRKVDGMSQNIPQMHLSASAASRRSYLQSSMPQSRVPGRQTLLARPSGMNQFNAQEYQLEDLRPSRKSDLRPSRKSNVLHSSMPQTRVPGQQAMPVTSNVGPTKSASMGPNNVHASHPIDPRPSRKSHVFSSGMSQSRVAGQQSMPVMSNGMSNSNQGTSQLGRSDTARPSRKSHLMYSMPQSRVPGQGAMPVVSNGGVGRATNTTPTGRDDGLATSLTSQMKQVQAEERFDNLINKTINRLGSAGGESNSLTSSFNSRAPSHQQRPPSILRTSTRASVSSVAANDPTSNFNASVSSLRSGRNSAFNSSSRSFQPAKVTVAPTVRRDRRSAFASRRASIVDSRRHITRRTSGETEVYHGNADEPVSTAAVDLPPL